MSFFKNLFGKQDESEEEEAVPEAVPADDGFPSEWGSFSTFIDDKLASIRLNLALAEEAPYALYPYAMRLKIALLQYDAETGFPSSAEFDSLNAIEDQLAEELAKVGGVHVGVVTTDGNIEFYFYLQDKRSHLEPIARVMKAFPSHRYDSATLADEDWTQYFDFLYPNDYEYQTILNQRVWYELERAGDDHSQERELDHWIYFASEEDRAAFAQEAEGLGYRLARMEKTDDSAKPYQLHLTRMDNTEIFDLNQNIWKLIEFVKKFDGDYGGWGCDVV
ncbi:hypothetical protein STRDD11_02332 [Streptococcus sp. DD11]|uniref:DUF695 domain-containing protein n=1 Tax=Streptococcus sp. DD11 TaxID=1777879 RepID=UPI0007932049|nr:DUF695 domain-containing protein [Streptococcus sp. DD11]KXT78996.1 hypothetical protein STRDD11_02332 [Streptococcus sp. DD11]